MDTGFMTMLAHLENMLDPRLTDEEIINTFSPLEHDFLDWLRNGIDTRASTDLSRGNNFLRDALQQRWPDQDCIFERYLIFSTKWNGRHLRRINHCVSHDELISLICSTPCSNPNQLARTLSILNVHDTPDILLGESTFGGSIAAYAVDINARFLCPDVPLGEMTNPQSPRLLDRIIMAIDQSLDPGLPWDTDLVVWSANGDDFLEEEPFCFFQLGALMVCAGQDWIDAREKQDAGDAGWMPTGYSVVVRLSPAGYPTGPVYAIYNFHQPRLDADRLWATWEEIEWRHSNCDDQELPHIRRLYPGCDQRFFMAKIADSLQDVDADTIDFDIVSRERCTLVRAKREGSSIIPNDVLEQAGFDVDMDKNL